MSSASPPLIVENRGSSWVTGGDPTSESLALYFAYYSRNGIYSFGSTIYQEWRKEKGATIINQDQFWPSFSNLNAALSGATSFHLQLQVTHLHNILSTHPLNNNDWKVCIYEN